MTSSLTLHNHPAEYSYPAFIRTIPTGRPSLPFSAHCADADSLTPPSYIEYADSYQGRVNRGRNSL